MQLTATTSIEADVVELSGVNISTTLVVQVSYSFAALIAFLFSRISSSTVDSYN
jgi:hypothetical protein